MKRIFTKIIGLLCFVMLFFANVQGQQDTVYIFQKGDTLYKRDVNKVDSMRYAKPNGNNTFNIYEKGAIIYSRAVMDIDSITFHYIYPSLPDLSEDGIYLSIYAFNNGIAWQRDFTHINQKNVDTLKQWMDKLSISEGRALYHTVDRALNRIGDYRFSANLENVSLISWVNGLDNGSVAFTTYESNEAYQAYIKERIDNETFHGFLVDAYGVGKKGMLENADPIFDKSIRDLSSSDQNAYVLRSVESVDTVFVKIANALHLSKKTAVVVLVLDMSHSIGDSVSYIKNAAKNFIEHLYQSPYAPPSIPIALQALYNGEYQLIALNWNRVKEATLYNVYRADSLNGDYQWIGKNTKNSYRDSLIEKEKTYYYKISAQNIKGGSPLSDAVAAIVPGSGIFDIEGNAYQSVIIGNQEWLSSNLKTTKYKNGDLIGTTVPLGKNLDGVLNPKYQWPAGGDEANVKDYGRLYTYDAAMDRRGVCPTGWRIPTINELGNLIDYLGGIDVAGGKLMAKSSNYWNHGTGSNTSGFDARAAGQRYFYFEDENDAFSSLKDMAKFLSSSKIIREDPHSYVPTFDLYYYDDAEDGDVLLTNYILQVEEADSYGSSVRCIKDAAEKPSKPLFLGYLDALMSDVIKVYGYIISEGSSAIIEKGFCWSTSPNPTVESAKTTTDIRNEGGYYDYELTKLTPNTTYYIRSFATNAQGTMYGHTQKHTTLSIDK